MKFTAIVMICGVLIAVIFAVDLITPQGFAEATLYAVVILIALRVSSTGFVVGIAAICSALTIIGYLISPQGVENWEYISNRGFALLGIWLVVGAGLMMQSFQAKGDRLQGNLDAREEQLRFARKIQQQLLPASAPELAGHDIAGVFQPADKKGGDYYDFIPLPDSCLGIAVGDVCGHGIGSALLMAEMHAFSRALAHVHQDVGKVLTLSNGLVWDDLEEDQFVTMFLGRLDPQRRSFVYAAAGQEAYLVDAGGQVMTLGHTGFPLGVEREQTIFSAEPVVLSTGSLIILMTDGVYEARRPDGSLFGVERALETVNAKRDQTARQIVDDLLSAVYAFMEDGPQGDDITTVVIKKT